MLVRISLCHSLTQIMEQWCRRPESNRHGPCGPTDFHTTSAFAAAIWRRGLDYLFTLARSCRFCPSSLYTFPPGEGTTESTEGHGYF